MRKGGDDREGRTEERTEERNNINDITETERKGRGK